MNFAFHTSLVICVNLGVYCGVVAQKKKKKKYGVGVRIMVRFYGACLGRTAALLRHATDSIRRPSEAAPGIVFFFRTMTAVRGSPSKYSSCKEERNEFRGISESASSVLVFNSNNSNATAIVEEIFNTYSRIG